MDKVESLIQLNNEWKFFFKKKRLEWVTGAFSDDLVDFFEHLSFKDATITPQEDGYVGESYFCYVITVLVEFKTEEKHFVFPINTVDSDTDSDESWAVDGWIEFDDFYEGSGHIEGDRIATRIEIDNNKENDIQNVLSEFKLKEKLEKFLYKLLEQEEENKANQLLEDFFKEPMKVKNIHNHRGYYTVEFEDGTIIQNATIIKKSLV